MSQCVQFESGPASEPNRANRIARFETYHQRIANWAKGEQRQKSSKSVKQFFKSLRIGAIRSAANSAPRFGTSKFPRAQFHTPNSVSLFGPHRAPGWELRECLSAYICVQKRTHRVFFPELTEFAPKLSEFSSKPVLSKQYSAHFLSYEQRHFMSRRHTLPLKSITYIETQSGEIFM